MSETVHASAVAWDGRALLITGASGQGKSGLALSLMALGCRLVTDDRAVLLADNGEVHVSPHPRIAGLIEARGVGILSAEYCAAAPIAFVVDLDRQEPERLPPRRFITLLGCDLPLIYRVDSPNWVPSLLQLLKSGWSDQ